MVNNKDDIFSNNLAIYLKEIEKIPLLNDMEEKKLFIDYKNGIKGAKEKLIEGNLRLVINVAREYADTRNNILDLIQEGNLALQRAVETYDIKKNIKFSTYAYSCIINKIISFKRKNHMIRIPDWKIILLSRIKKYKNDYYLRFGRMPSSNEIIMALGINKKILEETNKIPVCEISLNKKMKDNETEIQDLIINSKDELNDVIFDIDFWNSLLQEDVITPLEKEIVIAKIFGHKDELKKMETKYHISRETIRKKGIHALNNIKRKLQRDIIRDSLEKSIPHHEKFDINIMEKLSIFLPYLKKISAKAFFDMVKNDGLMNATLTCFSFGYLDSNDFTIKYIAQLLDIKEVYLKSITSSLSLTFKKERKVR